MSIDTHTVSDVREEMVKLIKTVVHCFKGKSQLRFFLGRQRLVFSPHRFVFLLLLFSSVAAAEIYSLAPDGGHARMQDRKTIASGTYHNNFRRVSGTERYRKPKPNIRNFGIKHAVITLIKGMGIGVCEAYRDNLNSPPLLITASKHYPHKINPVYADVLAKVDNWRLLEKEPYELLYLRLDNFYHYNKQFFPRSSRQMEYFKKKLQRIWPGGRSFITEMDIDNDGTPETVLRYRHGWASSLIVVNLEHQVIDEKASANLLLNRPMFYHRDIQALEQAANNIELLESGSELLAKEFDAYAKRRKLGARPWLESFWLPGEWREVTYDIFVYEDQVYFTRSDLSSNPSWHRGTGSHPCDRTRFFSIYTIEGDQTRQVCLYYNESTPINKQQ